MMQATSDFEGKNLIWGKMRFQRKTFFKAVKLWSEKSKKEK
jgi:hypothetical protein